MVDFKSVFLEKIEEEIRNGSIRSICDLGSGLSLNFLPILEKYPHLKYLGVEPSRPHAEKAQESLCPYTNAKVLNEDGYTPKESWGTYDLVISLSALEHIKQRERFLMNSIEAVRPGGLIIHRWDLGHALYPSSLKESLQVWLGNNWPGILPESKFVSLPDPEDVQRFLESQGVVVEKATYHQMPNHKSLIKHFNQSSPEAEAVIRGLIEWEFEVSPHLGNMDKTQRLRLFPAVALWGRKAI